MTQENTNTHSVKSKWVITSACRIVSPSASSHSLNLAIYCVLSMRLSMRHRMECIPHLPRTVTTSPTDSFPQSVVPCNKSMVQVIGLDVLVIDSSMSTLSQWGPDPRRCIQWHVLEDLSAGTSNRSQCRHLETTGLYRNGPNLWSCNDSKIKRTLGIGWTRSERDYPSYYTCDPSICDQCADLCHESVPREKTTHSFSL